ncbi:MAG: DUF1343 domain-containing protein [Candidatus Moduliflexus flocculans]|nr:DUF1343 domain-containing protein [Candidatus Moduliflexus flocculans]
MVKGIDVMVFDIQDVGTRVYTYVATMAYAMQAAAESGHRVHRPRPAEPRRRRGHGGAHPRISRSSARSSGSIPIPERHGMTTGELARLFNDKFLARKAKLTVVPMEGWTRGMWFDETGLPWIIPSPNMPTLDTATVYPGLVAIEGTNMSEGRGTTRPFELFGAPWIDAPRTGRGSSTPWPCPGVGIPGGLVHARISPSSQGQLCGGCQVHVTDREAFRSVRDGPPHRQDRPGRASGRIRLPRRLLRQGHGHGLGPQGPRGGDGRGDHPGQHRARPGRLRRAPQALFALLTGWGQTYFVITLSISCADGRTFCRK